MGIAKKYFMGIGAGSSGKIEYSDEYQFLEDNRVYTTKMLYIGSMKLGYSEDELFDMTPRKFFIIYNEFMEMNGLKKRKKNCSIDDLP